MTAGDLKLAAESLRVKASGAVSDESRAEYSQFFTPMKYASVVATLPSLPQHGQFRVLDAGAGAGTLSAAFVSRLIDEAPDLELSIVCVEIDPALTPYLEYVMQNCAAAAANAGVQFSYQILTGNFLDPESDDSPSAGLDSMPAFDLVVMNPPYRKLGASSELWRRMVNLGTKCPNLYAAFMRMGAEYLEQGGQLVSITPRSFANGPLFGDFRDYIYKNFSVDAIHQFESRTVVFSDTQVLQETVAISATYGGERTKVQLTSGMPGSLDHRLRVAAYDEIFELKDKLRYIRLAMSNSEIMAVDSMRQLKHKVSNLGVKVSTGRVVDFRVKSRLLFEAQSDAVCLVYPQNIYRGQIRWPVEAGKPQWLGCDPSASSLELPAGHYIVVKRFTSREETRRIVAAVWDPSVCSGSVAFENHLNVIHDNGKGLDRDLAIGLCLWLNSTLVDRYFRTFSGHTQANATDIRLINCPSVSSLKKAGNQYSKTQMPPQSLIDSVAY